MFTAVLFSTVKTDSTAGNVAQVVECSPGTQKALGWIPSTTQKQVCWCTLAIPEVVR